MIYMAKIKKYYKNDNKNFNDDSTSYNLKKFIIILIVIVGIIALIWFCMELKNGTFSKKDTEGESNPITIQYDEIMAGQTFNRKDSEYYVIFADSDKDFYNVYKGYITSSNKKIYIVDTGNSINDKYILEESNSGAQTSSELKVKDNTLIKISGGHNVLYLEGYENIIKEIKN